MRTLTHRVALAAVITLLAGTSHEFAQTGSRALGVTQNGVYHHEKTGVQFTVPLDWTIEGTVPSSDGGEMALLRSAETPIVLSVWMIRTEATPEARSARDVADRYRHVIGMKIRQRFDSGLRDYWVPADTIQEKLIGGKPALAAVGTYTERGVHMAECLTWIDTEQTAAFFFIRDVPAADLPLWQSRFNQVVETATVP